MLVNGRMVIDAGFFETEVAPIIRSYTYVRNYMETSSACAGRTKLWELQGFLYYSIRLIQLLYTALDETDLFEPFREILCVGKAS